MKKQCLLLAAAVLATLLVSATSESFAFYKLSLFWPTSACNVRADNCKTPIPNYFTIHGLWPHFANDTPVPSYTKDRSCTSTTPTSPDNLLPLLQPIENLLNTKWPCIFSGTTNGEFWKHEWERHGMCSDYPAKPVEYFIAASTLACNPNFNPLNVMGIQPGAQTTVGTILDNVYAKLRAYPEISCNMNGAVRQLREIRFCFDRTQPPFRIRSCPSRLDAVVCKTWNDPITFPSSSSISSIDGPNNNNMMITQVV